MLALMGDFVPTSIGNALAQDHRDLVINSPDNCMRFLTLADTEWVLCDVALNGAADGFGHGRMHLFAEGWHVAGHASQSMIIRGEALDSCSGRTAQTEGNRRGRTPPVPPATRPIPAKGFGRRSGIAPRMRREAGLISIEPGHPFRSADLGNRFPLHYRSVGESLGAIMSSTLTRLFPPFWLIQSVDFLRFCCFSSILVR